MLLGVGQDEQHLCLLNRRRRGLTKEINAMNVNTIGFDKAEEEFLIEELSDEALERAGGLENGYGMTLAMCSGLSSCPSAPQ
jgi:hypothetical protein